MASYVEVSNMASTDLDMDLLECSTPGSYAESLQSVEPEQQPKKKRKAWGQPVPEINPILPPRKRAKTAEEKEQRKNERILRNRRAADKSRQRQKAEVEALRQRQVETEAENARLKSLLAKYESQYGQLPGCDFNPDLSTSSTTQQHLSIPPLSLDTSRHNSDAFSECTQTPSLSFDDVSLYDASPSLAPTLNLGEGTVYPSSINATGMTQYPAEVLCDLQCQPVVSISKLRCLPPSRQLYEVLTSIHCLLMLQMSSTRTSLSQMFQLLMDIFSTSSTQPDLLNPTNFQLIHILITMPSTMEQKAVFRLKLLSRMLACNPNLALLLEKAADRTLQQLSEQDDWTENRNARWAWSTLMTIKWSIKWLEGEHMKIRAEVRAGVVDRDKWVNVQGVDYGAVEYTAGLWDVGDGKNNCTTTTMMDAECRPMNTTEVH